MELVGYIDGTRLDCKKENKVTRVVFTLELAIEALPPQEVAKDVVERTRLVKLAPRANKAAIAALDADLRSRASSFAAQDAASAAKVTPDLPPLPKRDAETVEEREQEYNKWTGAPPAALASVSLRLPFDSYALGATAPLQKWPKLRGRPTLVADPLTDMDGVELTTIKPIGALAKSLATGERNVQGKLRKQQGGPGEE